MILYGKQPYLGGRKDTSLYHIKVEWAYLYELLPTQYTEVFSLYNDYATNEYTHATRIQQTGTEH